MIVRALTAYRQGHEPAQSFWLTLRSISHRGRVPPVRARKKKLLAPALRGDDADLTLDWFDVCESVDHYLVLHSSPEVRRGNRKVQVLPIADRERSDADEVTPVIKQSAAT